MLKIVFLLVAFSFVEAEAQNKTPNILWIITDDQRPDAIAAYNQVMYGTTENRLGYVSSPNIDALAKEGVLFVNAYCNSPACSPSRSSMVTGQYPWHNGVYGFEEWHNGLTISKSTIPEVLKKLGYQTFAVGKTGVSMTQKKPGESNDVYDQFVNKKQYLMTKGFSEEDHNKNSEIFFLADGSKKVFPKNSGLQSDLKAQKDFEAKYSILRSYVRGGGTDEIYGGESPQVPDKMIDGSILKEFTAFLENEGKPYNSLSGVPLKGADPSRPVMVQLGFSFPHTPILPSKEFREKFKNKTYKVPAFSEDENALLPPQLLKLYHQMKVHEFKPEEMQQFIRDYYAFNAYGDALIGKAVKRFKEFCKQRKEEYLIIFTAGDHGWHLGEQGLGTKFAPYDISNHNAAIVVSSIKNGKFPEGKIVKDYVEFVDFAPTMFVAAGADIKSSAFSYLDGYDLSSTVDGNAPKRAYVLGEMNHVYGPRAYLRTAEFAFSMRTRPTDAKVTSPLLKDINWALNAPEAKVEMTLYDLRNDPDERKNVAGEKQYHELTAWLRKKLGNIVLGDNRVQANFEKENEYAISDFAKGAHDNQLDIPNKIIPGIN